MVDALPGHRAVTARAQGRCSACRERRWNLVLDDGVVVKLPEKGWQKQLDTLEHLIVDKGVLERDMTRNRSALADNYFFKLRKSGNKQQVQREEMQPDGRDDPHAHGQCRAGGISAREWSRCSMSALRKSCA